MRGAAINVWGVGTRMITSMDNPALGGVYKLSAEEVNGKFEPRIKISENPAKITNPGVSGSTVFMTGFPAKRWPI